MKMSGTVEVAALAAWAVTSPPPAAIA